MLVISLRSESHGFWSHLGIPDETPLFLAIKVSFRVGLEEIIKNRCHALFRGLTGCRGDLI